MTYDQTHSPRVDNSVKPQDVNEAALDAIWDELGRAQGYYGDEPVEATEKDMTTTPIGVEPDDELAADLVSTAIAAAVRMYDKLTGQ